MPHYCNCTINNSDWQELGGKNMLLKNQSLLNHINLGSTELPRMRTIEEAYAEIKSLDSGTAVTKNFIRTLIVSGKVPSVKAGRKYLINMDTLQNYLCNKVIARNETLNTGKIRNISDNLNNKRGI